MKQLSVLSAHNECLHEEDSFMMSLGRTPKRRLSIIKLATAQSGVKNHRLRNGINSFDSRIEDVAKVIHNWYLTKLDEDLQRVFAWESHDPLNQKAVLATIAEGFEAVDLDCDGIINNIEFYVLWRALEEKWERLGHVIRSPTPDRELKLLYELFYDYNNASAGVTQEDFVECRELIYRHVQALRGDVPNLPPSISFGAGLKQLESTN